MTWDTELRALLKEATPGPWYDATDNPWPFNSTQEEWCGPNPIVAKAEYSSGGVGKRHVPYRRADSGVIVSLRNSAEALADLVEAARERGERCDECGHHPEAHRLPKGVCSHCYDLSGSYACPSYEPDALTAALARLDGVK